MGRLVLAALAIQKNTREVADHFKWLRERQEAKVKPRSDERERLSLRRSPPDLLGLGGWDKESPTWTQAGLN
jgi:hypothetical protein